MIFILCLGLYYLLDFLVGRVFARVGLSWLYLAICSVINLLIAMIVPNPFLQIGLLILSIVNAYAAWIDWRNRRSRRRWVERLLGYKARALRAKLLAALPRPGGRALRPT